MRLHKHRILTFFVVILLVTFIIPTAFAANTKDSEFTSPISGTLVRYIDRSRAKQDSTPVYLCVNHFANDEFIWVRAVGSHDTSAPLRGDSLTLSHGINVDRVVCRVGINYSIHTEIYEKGFEYANLGFTRFYNSGSTTFSGTWSPDSYGSYAEPSNTGDNQEIM